MLVLLDLSAAFDAIDYSILLQRLQHVIGIKGNTLGWFISHLSDKLHFDLVLQDFVLGPILFILYMLPLGIVMRQHGINLHCYVSQQVG